MSECNKCYDADIEMDIIKDELTRTKEMLAVAEAALECVDEYDRTNCMGINSIKAKARLYKGTMRKVRKALTEINKMKEE